MDVISVRPTPDLERKIRKLMEFEKVDKSSIVRRALEKGLNDELKRLALKLIYRKRGLTGESGRDCRNIHKRHD